MNEETNQHILLKNWKWHASLTEGLENRSGQYDLRDDYNILNCA